MSDVETLQARVAALERQVSDLNIALKVTLLALEQLRETYGKEGQE